MGSSRRLSSITGALLLAALALPASAQTPSLVKDIATDPFYALGSSGNPRDLLPVGSRLFFSAEEPSSGRELWVTDGTAVGTEMLADACPGVCDSRPRVLGVIRSTVVFAASTPLLTDTFLWRSDGTRAGTFPLTSAGLPIPATQSVLWGGALYFASCGEGLLCGLWRTDGTLAGTRFVFAGTDPRVAELAAAPGRLYFTTADRALWTLDAGGRTASLAADAESLVVSGGKVFFTDSLGHGELWASDGTAAGTRELTGTSQLPSAGPVLAAASGRVYFDSRVGPERQGIWTSDGTAAGTHPVTRQPAAGPVGPVGGGGPSIVALGSRILFLSSNSFSAPFTLWAAGADGGPDAGVQLSPRAVDTPSDLAPLTVVGSRVLFRVGGKLWASDGTVAGTHSITDHCGCGSAVIGPEVVGGTAYFASPQSSPSGQYDLWQTDGTEGGTRRAVAPGPWSAGNQLALEVAVLGGRLYFNATSAAYGTELWSAKAVPGSPAEIVADISVREPSAAPIFLTAVGDHLIFNACTGFTASLWGTAGTAESTVPLAPDQSFACGTSDAGRGLGVIGGQAFFTVGSSPHVLYRTDGTPAGTLQLAETDPSLSLFSDPGDSAVLGRRLFFLVGDNDRSEVWASDGTPAGTGKAFDLAAAGLRIRWLGASDSRLFLGASDAAGAWQLWVSDGTPAGTHRADGANSAGLGGAIDSGFLPMGSSVLFFVAAPGATHGDLWASDGTPAGTARLVTGLPLASPVAGPVRLGGSFYLFVGSQLWRTDGTPPGTSLVRQFADRVAPPPSYLTSFTGRLYFAATDDASGTELWTSDGTPAGTVLLRDLWPGPSSSDPGWLVVAAGKLFFAADDGVHGRELWASDGTAAGTRLFADLAPEGASSSPAELTLAGGRLYFSADDGLTGRELWSLPLTGSGCPAGETHLCLGAGRFQVEVEWQDFQGRTGVGHAVPLTADSGSFWFFDAANLELIVKVLDARSLNGAFWVFYGSLSNVEYRITVTDTQTGLTRRYFNPAGRFASVGDTAGFGALGAFSSRTVPLPVAGPRPAEPVLSTAALSPCQAGPTRLCLQGGRFAVEASWQDFQDRTGFGMAVPLSGDTGAFWFFGPENLEVVVKVLDGRGLNGKFWVFYGALSNVGYTLTVTDTATGQVRTYKNPRGQFASLGDTSAF